MATRPLATDPNMDITACDREPIHIPGAIQPHGLLLVVDAATGNVVAGAGAIEERLAPEWLGQPLASLLGEDVARMVAHLPIGPGSVVAGVPVDGIAERFAVTAHRIGGERVLVELEAGIVDAPGARAVPWPGSTRRSPVSSGPRPADAVRARGHDFSDAHRFRPGNALSLSGRGCRARGGRGARRWPAVLPPSSFPASDIPKQARALYVRNRTRCIPDVDYVPAPIRPEGFETLDLSDVALRSVSPIHVRYLKNMGVAASASISIVKDGVLWGMIACHHYSPRRLSPDLRAAAAALAGRWRGRSAPAKKPNSTANGFACALPRTACYHASSAWAIWPPPSAA